MRAIIFWSIAFLFLFLGIALIHSSYRTTPAITGFFVREIQATPPVTNTQELEKAETTVQQTPVNPALKPAAAEATVDVSVTIVPSSLHE